MDSPIGPMQGYAYRSPFDQIAHVACVYNGIGDGRNVLTRFHKPNIVKEIFTGPRRMQAVLDHFKKNGSGVLIYLRDGAAGVPVAPIDEPKSAEADRHRQWREIGVGAQILRDLGVSLDPASHLVAASTTRGCRVSASRSSPTSTLKAA